MRYLYIIFLSSLLISASASTCFSFLGPIIEKTTKEQYAVKSSDLIFIGEVKAIERTAFDQKGVETFILKQTAYFENIDVLKGSAQSTVTLDSDKNNYCQCIYHFQVGVKYIVYANKGMADSKSYQTYYCGQIRVYLEDSAVLDEKTKLIEFINQLEPNGK